MYLQLHLLKVIMVETELVVLDNILRLAAAEEELVLLVDQRNKLIMHLLEDKVEQV